MFGPQIRHPMEGEIGGRSTNETARGSPRQQGSQTAGAGAAGGAKSLVQPLEFPAAGWRVVPEGRRSDRMARDVVERRAPNSSTKVFSLVVEPVVAPLSFLSAREALPRRLCATAFARGQSTDRAGRRPPGKPQ